MSECVYVCVSERERGRDRESKRVRVWVADRTIELRARYPAPTPLGP